MPGQKHINEKISELITELKRQQLWKRTEPAWVRSYTQDIMQEIDFLEWLQFVYLPNSLLYTGQASKNTYIMLQAKKHLSAAQLNEKLIQLMVELDAI